MRHFTSPSSEAQKTYHDIVTITVLKILNLIVAETLAAGTSHGRIAVWRMVQGGAGRGDPKVQWKLQTPTEIGGNVVQLQVQQLYHVLKAQ